MSYALALVAIVYVGDSSPLLERNNDILKEWPTWFIWGFNPAAATLASVVLYSALQAVCEFCTKPCICVDVPNVGVKDSRAFPRFHAAIKKIKERLKEEPFFFATLALWLAHAEHIWGMRLAGRRFVAFYPYPSAARNGDGDIVVTDENFLLLYSNAILATGLAAKALGVILPRHEPLPSFPRSFSGACGLRERWGSWGDSRASSLLVGWGIGYWLFSALYLLASSWHGSGWNNAPSAVKVVSYIVIPSFLLLSVFMVADTNFLGKRVEDFVEPATDRMRNRRRAEYWVMATVYRDFLVVWTDSCISLSLTQK